MAVVGGYWRPLAALARLLEELGELGRCLTAPCPSDSLDAELADVWIISTALADQFLAVVADPGSTKSRADERSAAFARVLAAAAPVARIVNYYDGPKLPRQEDSLGSLEQAIAELHQALDALARALDVDLALAVAHKLDGIAERDAGRFVTTAHDPSSAEVLSRFRQSEGSRHTLARSTRLWGAPDTCGHDVGTRARTIARDLRAFARAAGPERLDGYLIEIDGPPGERQEAQQLLDLLGAVAAEKPPSEVREEGKSGRRELRFMGIPLIVDAPCLQRPEPRASPHPFAILRPATEAR